MVWKRYGVDIYKRRCFIYSSHNWPLARNNENERVCFNLQDYPFLTALFKVFYQVKMETLTLHKLIWTLTY